MGETLWAPSMAGGGFMWLTTEKQDIGMLKNNKTAESQHRRLIQTPSARRTFRQKARSLPRGVHTPPCLLAGWKARRAFAARGQSPCFHAGSRSPPGTATLETPGDSLPGSAEPDRSMAWLRSKAAFLAPVSRTGHTLFSAAHRNACWRRAHSDTFLPSLQGRPRLAQGLSVERPEAFSSCNAVAKFLDFRRGWNKELPPRGFPCLLHIPRWGGGEG